MAGSSPEPLEGHSIGEDGRYYRRGARVLLVDRSGHVPRLLMMRGHDPHLPSRSFWFTPGGGREGQETPRATAVRELAEETGLVLEEHELEGPVWVRTAVFDFASKPYSQREEIYVADLAHAERRERADAAWTAQEEEALDELAWLTRDELIADGREVFPVRLLEDWSVFLEWNGETTHLGEVDE